jgi:hypothetical protein
MKSPDAQAPAVGGATMIRLFELITISLRARASYETRVWTALLLPILAGTVLHWTTRMKLEGLLLGVLTVIFYTIAVWIRKKHL